MLVFVILSVSRFSGKLLYTPSVEWTDRVMERVNNFWGGLKQFFDLVQFFKDVLPLFGTKSLSESKFVVSYVCNNQHLSYLFKVVKNNDSNVVCFVNLCRKHFGRAKAVRTSDCFSAVLALAMTWSTRWKGKVIRFISQSRACLYLSFVYLPLII